VLIIAAVVWQVIHLLMETTNILMDAVPSWIRLAEIQVAVAKIAEIKDIHHVHVRQINDSDVHLEAHVNLKENSSIEQCDGLRNQIEKLLAEQFRINHTMLQFEYRGCGESSLVKTR
jgi:cobalt-zinc-cadmium efflux system protein